MKTIVSPIHQLYLPPWRSCIRSRIGVSGPKNKLGEIGRNPTNRFQYYFVSLLLPSIGAVFSATERSTQMRDAAEVAIALELWHRRHGGWPETLAQLVPDLLPAVPPDRVDGKPLRYIVRDNRPVLYSLGANRRDDNGTSADPDSTMTIDYGILDPASPSRAKHADDWILFPPPKETIEDD